VGARPGQALFLFVTNTGELLTSLVDRCVNNGLINAEPLQKMGVVSFLNITKSLLELDERVAKVIAAREG
jgi:hypothetical protein